MMKLVRSTLSGLGIGLMLAAAAAAASAAPLANNERIASPQSTNRELPVADKILVQKAERRLYLLQGARVLRSYRIALGLNPDGRKERAGDFRTPEGTYRLVRRNPRSDYFLSLQVSYPNEVDLERARHNRWDPGGSIMIHGLPNMLKRPPEYYANRDWTDGCIALSNSDMLEIWLLTPDNVPIEIRP
jgi:murein L,D-transpeptidase YafK